MRKKALNERAGDEERSIAVPRSLHAADHSAAKAQAEAVFDCAQKCRHFQQLAERDRPSAQANWILRYARARIEPLVLNRSRLVCGDDGAARRRGAPNSACLKGDHWSSTSASLPRWHSLGHRSSAGSQLRSFSFNEVWTTGLAAPAVNGSHETKRSDKVAQTMRSRSPGSLDHHPLSRHEKNQHG